MTTITDKITMALDTLQCFDDVQEFSELCTIIRNDLLGMNKKNIPYKRMAKRFNVDQDEIE